jgi:poly(hydroxyalkanoate) depolymerase family esterase
MQPLSETIARLAALRGGRQGRVGASDHLQPLGEFGSNPGDLGAWMRVPDKVGEGPPLVVVLHGCAQNAAGYDQGSGWSRLADDFGFALLYPEQRRANNANLCFNWFEPGDTRRGAGEALSIVQMVETMIRKHAIDRSRIFVTGLSAGGAMTSVLLATYPEIFAGGAIIAGLPFGAAANVQQALERMRGAGGPGGLALAAAVRSAAPPPRRWPKISIWHGTADHVVASSNADASLVQWQSVYGLLGAAHCTEAIGGHTRRVWLDGEGEAVIEDYRIRGMGHGTPIATTGAQACGQAGPHMLEAGISSTRCIADNWKLTGHRRRPAAQSSAATGAGPAAAPVPGVAEILHRDTQDRPGPSAPAGPRLAGLRPAGLARVDVGKVIDDALRAAGLVR